MLRDYKDRLIQNGIVVRRSPIHGHGVFAEKPINKDEIVEECRILLSDGNDIGLSDYYYHADENEKCIFLTGYGVLYNHSDQPNLDHHFDKDRQIAMFQANRFIQRGEELFISYGTAYFTSRKMEKRELFKWRDLLNPKKSLPMRALLACMMAFLLVHLISLLK